MKKKNSAGGSKTKLRGRLKKYIPELSVAGAVILLIIGFVSYTIVSLMREEKLSRTERQVAAAMAVTPKPAATPTPTPEPSDTPQPTETPEAEEKPRTAFLNAGSTEADLYILIKDENGSAITGEIFTIDVKYPDGNTWSFQSEGDGSCYLVNLDAGEYGLSLREKEGFAETKPITATVKPRVQRQVIENITQVVEVVNATQVAHEEKDTNAAATTASEVVEQIVSEKTDAEEPLHEEPVLDDKGNPTYTYTYQVGPNGYLLLSDGVTESDVLPVEVNGVLSYGMRRIVTTVTVEVPADYVETAYHHTARVAKTLASAESTPPEETQEPEQTPEPTETPSPEETTAPADSTETPEQSASPATKTITVEEESSERVELFNADNTPISTYAITATPITQTVSRVTGWQSVDGAMRYFDSSGYAVTGLKNIDGKVYYFDASGNRCGTLGVDVSYHKGAINWSKVRDSGIEFAIIRIGGRGWGSGKVYEDGNAYKLMSNGGRYLQEAKAAGLKVGIYFYSSAIDTAEAVEEASVAIDLLKKSGVWLDYPIFIDMEHSGEYPEGRADKLSADQHTEIVKAFCDTVINAGYSAGVYAGEYYFNNDINYSQVSGYTVWLASYTRGYKRPAFSGRYDIWQLTDSGVINGVNDYVDIDVIF